MELKKALRVCDLLRVLGINNRVHLIHDLKEALGGGLRLKGEGEQEAKRLCWPPKHHHSREEGHQGPNRDVPLSHKPDSSQHGEPDCQLRNQNQIEPNIGNGFGLTNFGGLKVGGLVRKLVRCESSASKGL